MYIAHMYVFIKQTYYICYNVRMSVIRQSVKNLYDFIKERRSSYIYRASV
jgi:hypothetical protein